MWLYAMNVRWKGPRSLEKPGLSKIGHLSREWGRKLTRKVHDWHGRVHALDA